VAETPQAIDTTSSKSRLSPLVKVAEKVVPF